MEFYANITLSTSVHGEKDNIEFSVAHEKNSGFPLSN